ncbi:unnamed protein product, partial [Adineta steineri]
NNEKKDISVETEESNEIITPPSQLRSRRLRYRFHRHTPSITTQESIPDSPVEFFISNETPSSPQSQPQPPTPPLSPTTTISSTTTTSSNTLSGGLKRNASKSNVVGIQRRFFVYRISFELSSVGDSIYCT